mmetsp:Transcript_8482/g.13793  ORF Transcript_8482/g.13793 Transcript_8482/m.13793 type:complete len:212 (-) Transcript_8482:90-725(-)
MKPDWDKLTEEYADSQHAGIYDVDCTAGGKDLCDEVGVQGYPTIKYGDPADKKELKKYEGGRDLASLKKFAEENLAPVCGPASMDACSEEEKSKLEGFLKKPSAELLAEAKKLEKDFAAIQKKLDKKSTKHKEKSDEFFEDDAEHQRSKVKKGKEKQHEEKTSKLKARREKLKAEKESIAAEQDKLKEDIKSSGVKLMKLAAKANKDRTDL